MKRITLELLLACSVLVCPVMAQTYVGSCHGVGFATISAAVASVPSGATINVCPGNYPEQVTITKPLTLQGVAAAGSNAATVIASATDSTFLNYNGILNRPSILVEAGPVNITNINISAVYSTNDCTTIATGIAYVSGSSGTVNHTNASVLPAVAGGCTNSVGVWIENENVATVTTVTVQNSTLEVEGTGIWAHSGQPSNFAPITYLKATGNLIFGNQPNSFAVGVYVDMAQGSVSNNSIHTSLIGVDLNTNAAITVSGNTVDSVTGIDVFQAKPTITGNKIYSDTGLDLNCQLATVTGNTFLGGRSGIASTGILNPPVALTGANNYFNVATQKFNPC